MVNAKKTQAIVIGSPYFISRMSESVVKNLSFDGTIIPFSATVRNLGIIMDQTLSWSAQVADVSRKVFASLHSLRRLQNFLPLSTKITLAQSLLLPLLDYGDISYLDLAEGLLDRLDRLQNVCIRYIFGLRKYDHVSHYRAQLKWLPIRDRRNIHILSLLFNSLFNPSAPIYLSERFSYLSVGSQHRLRSNSNLLLACPSSSSKTYSKSFTVHSTRLWNRLPTSIRQSPSIVSFREGLKKMWLAPSS